MTEKGRACGNAELSERALERWGRRLGSRAVEAGSFVALFGPLGSGKTRLIQAACRGAGVVEPVLSPTFMLVHRYAGRAGPIYHCDLYRIGGPQELYDLGWEELIASEGPVFVEWAERAEACLPPDRWEIWLAMGERSATRTVRVSAFGGASRAPDPGGS